MAMRRLGQILVDLGFISDDQLESLLEEHQSHPGVLLGKLAESQGLINEDQLAQALAEQWGMQVVHLADIVIPPNVLGMVTETMAQMYRIVPIVFRDDTLTIALCDPQNLTIQDELRTFLGYEIRSVVSTSATFSRRWIAITRPVAKASKASYRTWTPTRSWPPPPKPPSGTARSI